jgi:hypothetical protein
VSAAGSGERRKGQPAGSYSSIDRCVFNSKRQHSQRSTTHSNLPPCSHCSIALPMATISAATRRSLQYTSALKGQRCLVYIGVLCMIALATFFVGCGFSGQRPTAAAESADGGEQSENDHRKLRRVQSPQRNLLRKRRTEEREREREREREDLLSAQTRRFFLDLTYVHQFRYV